MPILLSNALLCDLDPPRVEPGALRLAGGRIVARGADLVADADDEVVDCGGAAVLPGLVNGHTHLYSALAVGMPPPPRAPRNFPEILRFVWWRLDRALDAETIELSARIGTLQALRCGTTTLIDHHASPSHIEGSLSLVERGVAAAGLRAVLCYEVTDRHGTEGRTRGLTENCDYVRKTRESGAGRFAGLIGAHAAFTLGDAALEQIAACTRDCGVGVHIHVAEDPCDEHDARNRHGQAIIGRLEKHGLLQPDSIFAHCTHLDARAIARVNETGATVAHNARSNMNNAVGYAPVAQFRCPVMLGTDGIGGDMFAEARAAWMISRHQAAGLTPADILQMLAAGARRASASLDVTLGRLEIGAAADVVVTDYVPFTPLAADNLAGHFLFGMSSSNVRSVLVGGDWRLRERVVIGRDTASDTAHARRAAEALWKRMAEIPLTP